tara:strand:+ start:531 stop:872 length:342 start_codon:yes stop_codon:yes gene_type:complete
VPADNDKRLTTADYQAAARQASRGPHATLLHLLVPICIFGSFSLLYVLPMLVAGFWSPSRLSTLLHGYLNWSLPLVIVVNLASYHWARRRLLAPYLRVGDDYSKGKQKDTDLT